jgi:hypothetical protein
MFYHDTQYSQLGRFTNLFWCDIPLSKAPRTSPHHIWRIYTLCPFSGHEKNTDDRAVGWMISLASVCYCESRVGKLFFSGSVVSNQNFFDGLLSAIRISSMVSSSSLIFSPAVARDALFTLLCRTRRS